MEERRSETIIRDTEKSVCGIVQPTTLTGLAKARVGKAAAYAVIGIQTAYLMCYYPTECIAAMLNSIMGDNEKVAYYIRYAKELGIEVLPPDINESFARFTVSGSKIRFGLAAIKNVGINVINSIVSWREKKGKFTNIADFADKIDLTLVNKRAVESMIKAGAFDCFKVYRSKLLAVFEKVLDGAGSVRRKNIDGQMSLFTALNAEAGGSLEVDYPEINEFEKKYILAMEKEMTGLYLSGHPLDEFEDALIRKTSTKISDIVANEVLEEGVIEDNSAIKDGDRVIIGGIISEVSKKLTKNNNMMAFMRVQDIYGSVEVVVFPNTYEKNSSLINADGLVIVKGRVSIREDEQPKVICEEIKPLREEVTPLNNGEAKNNAEQAVKETAVYIQIESMDILKNVVESIKPVLAQYKGNFPLYLCTKKEKKKFRLDKEYNVSVDEALMGFLINRFGNEQVKVL